MNADSIIQKNFKKIIIFIISILCLFSLTGCNAKADTTINYKEDGTGNVSMTLLLPNEVFKDENVEDQNTENVENTENSENSENGESGDEEIEENSDDNATNSNNSSTTTQLFTKSELLSLLKERFVGFKFKELNENNYSGYKISANYNNKQVKQFIDDSYKISSSGIGHKYSVEIPIRNFLPIIQNDIEDEEDTDETTIEENSNALKSAIQEETYIEANKTTFLSSNLMDMRSFLGKKAQLSMTITMPGELTECTLNDYATEDGNKITIDLSKYMNDSNYTDASDYESSITVKSKKLGGSAFKIVILLGVFLLFWLISNLIKKINKGPFED